MSYRKGLSQKAHLKGERSKNDFSGLAQALFSVVSVSEAGGETDEANIVKCQCCSLVLFPGDTL